MLIKNNLQAGTRVLPQNPVVAVVGASGAAQRWPSAWWYETSCWPRKILAFHYALVSSNLTKRTIAIEISIHA